jgi:hypothetical protein
MKDRFAGQARGSSAMNRRGGEVQVDGLAPIDRGNGEEQLMGQ